MVLFLAMEIVVVSQVTVTDVLPGFDEVAIFGDVEMKENGADCDYGEVIVDELDYDDGVMETAD